MKIFKIIFSSVSLSLLFVGLMINIGIIQATIQAKISVLFALLNFPFLILGSGLILIIAIKHSDAQH